MSKPITWGMIASGRTRLDLPGMFLGDLAFVLPDKPLMTIPFPRKSGLLNQTMKQFLTRATGIQTGVTASTCMVLKAIGDHRNSHFASDKNGGGSIIVIPCMQYTFLRHTAGIGGKVVRGGQIEALMQPPPDVPGSIGRRLTWAGQTKRSRDTDGIARAPDAPQNATLPSQLMRWVALLRDGAGARCIPQGLEAMDGRRE